MHVRPRRPDDLPALVEILTRTHVESGYPVRATNVRPGWLAEDHELGAWVADDGRPVGHVALHPPRGPSCELWRTATGRDDSGLAVVSRLLSDLRGAGSALLARAEQEATALGRVPVLEVELGSAARTFYLRRGWTQVGEVGQRWGEHDVRVAVLVGGAAARIPGSGGGSAAAQRG